MGSSFFLQGGADVQKNPLEFKKRLLASVYSVRQAFQEKHVKVLRLKQEYFGRGAVPNAINRYMEELNQVLKATADYITRLSGVRHLFFFLFLFKNPSLFHRFVSSFLQAITSEQNKMMQQQQQQMFNQRATAFQNQNMFRGPTNMFHNINTNTPITINQMNPAQRAAFNQYLANMKAAQAAKFATTSNTMSTGPVITEVEDSAPNENNKKTSAASTSTIISAPSTSTVTIKEIT